MRYSRCAITTALLSGTVAKRRQSYVSSDWPTKLAKLSLKGVWLFTYSVLWASSWITVATSSIVSRSITVESSGSEKYPSVENAPAGRKYVSYPSLSRLAATRRACAKSKKPLYGTAPTMGKDQVYSRSRSRRAAESTSSNVSRPTSTYVV